MRLCVIFLIWNIQLGHIFAFPQNSPESSAQTNTKLTGYECGNTFFTDSEVHGTLLLAKASLDKGTEFPQPYQGELYSDSRHEEYFLYPIIKGSLFQPQNIALRTIYRVVFTRESNEAVDVVAKITNGDYTKCIRRDGIQRDHRDIGPSNSMQENTNGYLCAHKFITNEFIHQSLALAQIRVEAKTLYPCPYVGLLYPANSGYLLWPMTRGKKLYRSGQRNLGPTYLILNSERQFVDIVVKGYRNNFLRCIPSRKPPKAPESDPLSTLFVPPPKPGYFCGKVFFDEKLLEAHAERVKKKGGKPIKGQFLEQYSGPPYDRPCLIWPIMSDGSLYKWGHKGAMRLILTPDYKVLSVAISVEGKLKPCEKKTITAKKNHDISDYLCNRNQISHRELLAAANRACVKMNERRNSYPARYKGSDFKLEGPYFTFPVYRDGGMGKHGVGQHRVVINTNCEVVGALTSVNDYNNKGKNNRFMKRLVKCHRVNDGPLPLNFFGPNAETVFEYCNRNKK